MEILLNTGFINDSQAIQKISELCLINVPDLCLTAGPFESAGFQSLIQEYKAVPLPDQGFESILPGPAEEKQYIFLKRIQLELFLDDGGKTVDAFTKVCFAAGNEDLAEACNITKHSGSPPQSETEVLKTLCSILQFSRCASG